MAEEYAGRKFTTEFVGKKIVKSAEASSIVSLSKKLRGLGFLHGIPGNFSRRTMQGFAITAGGVAKDKITEEDVVEVLDYDEKENTIYATGLKEPSSEARMHWMIYKRFPEVNAILHVHDQTILDNETKAKEAGAVYTKREFPYGTIELAKQAVDALSKWDYIVMINHGPVAVGSSLDSALELVKSTHRKVAEIR